MTYLSQRESNISFHFVSLAAMTILRDKTAQIVLNTDQQHIQPLLEEFSSTHILVWWTAIALQLAHRKSIDFDLFCFGPQGSGKQLHDRIIKTWLMYDPQKSNLLRLSDDEQSEVTLRVNEVKIQLLDFSRNPFDISVHIDSSLSLCGWIPSCDLLTLWAMKCYAMMYRKTIKDAVDIYYILQNGYILKQLIHEAQRIFDQLYKPEYTIETLLSQQRDTTETIDWIGDHPNYETIFQWLIDLTKQYMEEELK